MEVTYVLVMSLNRPLLTVFNFAAHGKTFPTALYLKLNS